uniref:Uncharacterized protein n=1 Tax=viral metagenome TaxID=1070528 RepID=A0A6C0H3J6_9ZZZZ
MVSNMSIKNCKIPIELDFWDRLPLSSQIEPKKEDGFKILNPSARLSKYATDFYPIDSGNQWGSKDPRLFSSSRNAQVLTFDRPPVDGSIPLEKISTDKSLNGYGKNYRTYSDINAGHITYYIDKSIKDPLFEPIFSIKALSTRELYRDPMGSLKTQYERHVINKSDPINNSKYFCKGEFSWMEDTQEHREDMFSKQMRKNNQQRWEPRWA